MLKISRFELGPIAANCYVLTDEEEKRAVVVDPGAPEDVLTAALDGLTVEAVLLTHAHFDHIGGVDLVRKTFGCPVWLHPLEKDWLSDPRLNGSARWPEVTPPVSIDPPERELNDGDTFELIGETFRVLHIPGHSPGSVGFLCGNLLFGGDVLFRRSVGRTDLPFGDAATLERSIRDKLYVLPDDVVVFPGHGPATTIGEEKRDNPFVRVLRG